MPRPMNSAGALGALVASLVCSVAFAAPPVKPDGPSWIITVEQEGTLRSALDGDRTRWEDTDGSYRDGISVTKCLTPEACRAWSNSSANTCVGLCNDDDKMPCLHPVTKADVAGGFGAEYGFECAAGHTGALCGVCEGDHFMAANGTCLSCDDDRNTVAAATAIGLCAAIAALMAALLWVARKNAGGEAWRGSWP